MNIAIHLQRFVDHEAFEEIKKRAIFVHVVIPGHEENGADLPDSFNFPIIQVSPCLGGSKV